MNEINEALHRRFQSRLPDAELKAHDRLEDLENAAEAGRRRVVEVLAKERAKVQRAEARYLEAVGDLCRLKSSLTRTQDPTERKAS